MQKLVLPKMEVVVGVLFSHPIVSDSLRSYGLQPARPPSSQS